MNKYIKVIIIAIIVIFNLNNSFANNVVNSENVDIYSNVILKEDYENIEKVLNEISLKIELIDNKLKKVTETEEYENYPTVRLNVSTPFFGITSIIDSKLRITKDVSFIDIINGYNIREVIKKKVVKVPVFDVADIIVITKDVNIDENMTKEDGKVVLSYLFNYLKQVNYVNEFCDDNITDIFKEFFVKEKRDLMNEYFNEFNKLTGIKKELDNNISYYLLNSLNNKFDYNEYLKYIEKYDMFSNISKNVFLKKEDIIKHIEEIKLFMTEIENYNNNFLRENVIDKISSYEFKSNNLKEIIDLRVKYLENEIKYLEDFITNKDKKILIEKDYEVKNNNILDESILSNNEEKIIKRYVVNSEKIILYLQRLVENIKLESLKINDNLDVDIYDDEIDIYKSDDLIEKRNDKYFRILNIVNDYTLEFVNYEVGFYFNNIRNIYKDIDKNNDDIMKNFDDYKFMYVYLLPSLKELEYDYIKRNYLSNLLTIKQNKEYLNKMIKISENLYKLGEESVK